MRFSFSLLLLPRFYCSTCVCSPFFVELVFILLLKFFFVSLIVCGHTFFSSRRGRLLRSPSTHLVFLSFSPPLIRYLSISFYPSIYLSFVSLCCYDIFDHISSSSLCCTWMYVIIYIYVCFPSI